MRTARPALSIFGSTIGVASAPKPPPGCLSISRQPIRRQAEDGRGGHPAPRIQDIRHAFACRRLERWYTLYNTGVRVSELIGMTVESGRSNCFIGVASTDWLRPMQTPGPVGAVA
jgi:hypothetical protein